MLLVVGLRAAARESSISAGHSDAGISDCAKEFVLDLLRRVSSGSMPSVRDSSRDRRVDAAGALRSSANMRVALADRLAHHVVERLVGGGRDGGRERAAERAVRLGRRLEQHVERQLVEHLRGRGLVQHGEARRDIGLERKLVQQPRAEGVDGLHLQPARRLQRRARTAAAPARAAPRRRSRRSMSSIVSSSAASSSAIHSASRSNTRFAMLAAAALVKVMQRIFAGSTPRSSSRITRCASTWVLPEPALARHPGRDVGIGGLDLHARRTIGGNDARRRSCAASVVAAAGQRPFLHAREMVVVAVCVFHIGCTSEQIGRRLRPRSCAASAVSRASAWSACASGVPSLNSIAFGLPAGSPPCSAT